MNGFAHTKRRAVTAVQKYVANPLARPLAGSIPGWALLETTGQRTGKPRRTPVGGRLAKGSVWLVAEHGRKAAYVRNMQADPRVRVKVRGRWRRGIAHLLDEDDPRRRALWVNPVNGLLVRLVGTDLLTIRIDLEPGSPRSSARPFRIGKSART